MEAALDILIVEDEAILAMVYMKQLRELGYHVVEAKDGAEALERLAEPEAAGETASSEKNILYLLGETCHLAGDDGAARAYFDRLASLYPEFRNLRAYLEVFDFRNVINLRS